MSSRLDAIDIFIPNAWEYFPDRAAKSRKAGHQVWWYICNGPRAPYANWFIECQAIEARLLMGAMAQRAREALAVPREVMDTMTNYTDDPAALYRWRDEMADLIEEAR